MKNNIKHKLAMCPIMYMHFLDTLIPNKLEIYAYAQMYLWKEIAIKLTIKKYSHKLPVQQTTYYVGIAQTHGEALQGLRGVMDSNSDIVIH
jgi:hypothetical protein